MPQRKQSEKVRERKKKEERGGDEEGEEGVGEDLSLELPPKREPIVVCVRV